MAIITEDTTQVIHGEDCWWRANENIELFKQPLVQYNYEPYSLRFEEEKYPNFLCVRKFVYLNILLGNSLLLDAGIIYNYNININSIDNLKDELFKVTEDAHKKFIHFFEGRRVVSCISPTFHPTIDYEVFSQKYYSVPQTGGIL